MDLLVYILEESRAYRRRLRKRIMDAFERYLEQNKCNPECRALTCKSYGEVYKREHHCEIEPKETNFELATYGDALLKFALCSLLLDKCTQLTEEKKQYETDKFLIETVAKHYQLLDYMNFDRSNNKIPQCYEAFENESTKYIATTVEAVLGAIYQKNEDFQEISGLVESWTKL